MQIMCAQIIEAKLTLILSKIVILAQLMHFNTLKVNVVCGWKNHLLLMQHCIFSRKR